MAMSQYYKDLREAFGPGLIFMPCVAAMIRNEKDEILFGRKHNEENWGLIAGAVEIGETPAEAVRREVLEETGLEVKPERIIGVFGGEKHRFTYPNGHQVEYLTVVFECAVVGGALHPENDEMCELGYFQENGIPPLANYYPREIFRKEEAKQAIFE